MQGVLKIKIVSANSTEVLKLLTYIMNGYEAVDVSRLIFNEGKGYHIFAELDPKEVEQ